MDQTRRFYAYSNYLVATARLMNQCHPSDTTYASTMASMPGVARIQRRSPTSLPRVAELLRNSWFTEVTISQALNYPGYLPYSNPWAMVQAYYSVYLATRAYFHAFDRVVKQTHAATLSTVSHDLVGTADRFPEPWASVVQGDTKTKPVSFANSRYHNPLFLSSALDSPNSGDPWQHYLLFLKTTRDRQIKTAIDVWKRSNRRQRIKSGERTQLVSKLRPTSIFDALYRIRARSNYRDVDSFAFGTSTVAAAEELHVAIARILYHTLFMFELLISRSIGKRNFSAVIQEFLGSAPGSQAVETVEKRWQTIKNHA